MAHQDQPKPQQHRLTSQLQAAAVTSSRQLGTQHRDSTTLSENNSDTDKHDSDKHIMAQREKSSIREMHHSSKGGIIGHRKATQFKGRHHLLEEDIRKYHGLETMTWKSTVQNMVLGMKC